LTFDHCKLDEVIKSEKGSIAMGPFGSNITADNFVEFGVPVIQGRQLNGLFLEDIGYRFLTPEKAKSLKNSKAVKRDIVITHRGTIGQVGIIPDHSEYDEYIISQSQLKFTVDEDICCPFFTYYFLCSHIGQYELLMNTTSVGVPAIASPTASVKNITIPFPKLSTQQKISTNLKMIDLQILKFRKIEESLQMIIASIFRSWFIDFDPVKTKAEGKIPYGLDEETIALFPNSFEDSELGLNPTGWKVKNYSDYMDLKYGGALKAGERIDGEFPVLGSNGIVGEHNEYLVNGPGIVIGRKGNPGTINWINENFFPIDTTFYVQTKDENVPLEFLYHSLNFASLPWFSADSAVPGINRNVILQQKFIFPPIELIEAFRKISVTIFQQNLNTRVAMNSIESLRDAILPRLMSGELKVN